ncbi:TPA: helix-turn-helix transcriptional regulator [Candidatus Woesearchaeota archaeon]|nr:helix-turn-helix transcriptional regulator [Candidatus Woesearchaeota archaeon]HIH32600.1 helix-turn-helix transcriptional regulator [Candidatus Woesearchaeota archaeon]HIH54935.1 helix-turn-helix transcriptional regulator [Candidatus Woesearchaeota archaeon]HIJ01777.1 helix-turn-helix transcriptional regulator [Candidatus Woesearchaeota archaeon]HIJ14019.1 helix-turn-helix transcriptional regulator [Candidatus Woesearchaeota archaeon]
MDKSCPVYYASNLIGKRWTIAIILELYKGESKWKRYHQIKSKLPQLTPKILSTRLRELADEGILLKRVDSSQVPIKSEYCLTKKGEDFIGIIHNIRDWVQKHKPIKRCTSKDCRHCLT